MGDLSLVYPLTRGTGPLLSTVGAIMLLGERPTPSALAGMLLVVVGLFLLTGGLRIFRASTGHLVLRYGTLTGLFIACYTLWDKQAVSGAHVSPLPYNYGVILVRGGAALPLCSASLAYGAPGLARTSPGGVWHRCAQLPGVFPGTHGAGVYASELHRASKRDRSALRGHFRDSPACGGGSEASPDCSGYDRGGDHRSGFLVREWKFMKEALLCNTSHSSNRGGLSGGMS
jgi:hypothetical protein